MKRSTLNSQPSTISQQPSTKCRPLPARVLYGVGRVTEQVLLGAGIRTVGDSQDYSGDLRALVGSFGPKLKQFALGEDDRPLELGDEVKSIRVPKIAHQTGVDEKARTFSSWSHTVSLGYAQLTHALSLNDVCDGLQLNSGPLSAIRGATPPTRNNLSHANKVRDAVMAETLFWEELKYLGDISPGFVSGKAGKRFLRKFKRKIYAIDSTTIPLIASCMDWAKHRRRKAAAKCHLRLDLQSFLPRFAIIDTARQADAKRAREICAGVKEGEIVLFDKAYVDFDHLWDMEQREVIWVTRAKENLQFEVMQQMPVPEGGKVVTDELVGLKNPASQRKYPELMRRVTAWVEVDGKEQLMVFLTNQLTWSPATIVELYRCRWEIEVFFKQLKQTLQLADFLGTSANAVRWQIWTALLIYLLLRYLAYLSHWAHSFSRLFAIIRTGLWRKWHLPSL